MGILDLDRRPGSSTVHSPGTEEMRPNLKMVIDQAIDNGSRTIVLVESNYRTFLRAVLGKIYQPAHDNHTYKSQVVEIYRGSRIIRW
jgi:hypothetical protein